MKLRNENYPLQEVINTAKTQMKVPDDSKVMRQGDLKMPTVTLKTTQIGTVGRSPTKNLDWRERFDETIGNPEQNLHDQWVKTDYFEN